MLAVVEGHAHVIEWLVEHGAALDHTAKYGLSALMFAIGHGHIGLVRKLTDAGTRIALRGTGAPGFWDKTALDLAMDRGDV
jgi:ankyrin repeat protein